MTKIPHYSDVLNNDGSYNIAAIMQIAHVHRAADYQASDTAAYRRRAFATELRMVWGVARMMRSGRNWRKAA
jgi:hypothetical protein